MENVTFIEIESFGVITEHAIIDHGNNEFTSMPKSVYDAQMEHLTSPLTDPTA